jgi:hypothetical protein
VEVLIQDKCEAARAQLSKLVSKECDSPFTLNNHYFTDRYSPDVPQTSALVLCAVCCGYAHMSLLSTSCCSKKKYLGQMKAQLRPELSQVCAGWHAVLANAVFSSA